MQRHGSGHTLLETPFKQGKSLDLLRLPGPNNLQGVYIFSGPTRRGGRVLLFRASAAIHNTGTRIS